MHFVCTNILIARAKNLCMCKHAKLACANVFTCNACTCKGFSSADSLFVQFFCSCISGKLHVQNFLYVQHSATRVMFLPISLTANRIVPPIVARKYCESTRTSRKRIDKVQRATIIALRNANLCVEEIATQTGSIRATIFRVLKSLKQPNVKHLKKMGRKLDTVEKFVVDTVEKIESLFQN